MTLTLGDEKIEHLIKYPSLGGGLLLKEIGAQLKGW